MLTLIILTLIKELQLEIRLNKDINEIRCWLEFVKTCY